MLLIFNLVAMVGFVLVILVPVWQSVIVGEVLFIYGSAVSLPATMSLMCKVLPRNKRTMGVSMHSLVRRIQIPYAFVFGVIGTVEFAVFGCDLPVSNPSRRDK